MWRKRRRVRILLHNLLFVMAERENGDPDHFDAWLEELCKELGTTPEELTRLGVDLETIRLIGWYDEEDDPE